MIINYIEYFNMRDLLLGFILLSQLPLLAQTVHPDLDSLLSQKSKFQDSISYYQDQLVKIESQIDALRPAEKKVEIVTESGAKIVATVGDSGAILRDQPKSQSNELKQIPAHATIYVHQEYQGLYFKVTYFGQEGWVNYTKIEAHPDIEAIIQSQENLNKPNPSNAIDINEADPKFLRLKKIYGEDKAMKMMTQQLWKGMSHGQVRESLGKPVSQSRENTPKGLKEEWVFEDRTLVFLNGTLITW